MYEKLHSRGCKGACALRLPSGSVGDSVAKARARVGPQLRMSCSYVYFGGALRRAKAGSLGALRAAEVPWVPSESMPRARGATGA